MKQECRPTQYSHHAILRDESGMALLIVVMTIALLIVITYQFHDTSWSALQLSHNYRLSHELESLDQAGLTLGIEVLRQDDDKVDHLMEPWHLLGDERITRLSPRGALHIIIEDLSGRLPINYIVQQDNTNQQPNSDTNAETLQKVLEELLLSGEFAIEDEADVSGLIDSLIDWLDTDDHEEDQGAEESYYAALDPAYGCRNGPLRSVDELLLVKGMTSALLYGTADTLALADFITIYSETGRININSAPPQILLSLNEQLESEQLDGLINYRSNEENISQLSQVGWYKLASNWPGDIILDENVLSVVSNYFKITAFSNFDTMSRKVSAIVHRESQGTVQIISRQVE